MPTEWTRREALVAAVAAGFTGFAGCQGDGEVTQPPASRSPSESADQTTRTEPVGRTDRATETQPSTETVTRTQTATPPGPDTFIGTDGSNLTLDGDSWYFNGVQYSGFPFDQNATKVYEVLEDAAEMNATVLRSRVGCAGRGPQAQLAGDYCLQPSPGEYNEAGFELLDQAIAWSKRFGHRFVLWFVNNWRLAGNGVSQYVAWATGEEIPEDESSTAAKQFRDRFYSNEEAKQLYKDFVEYVLTRENTVTGVQYRNDPSIALWELVNEGKALPENRDAFHEWHREMAAFVSDLAPDQLVGTGGIGRYRGLPEWADEQDRDWLSTDNGSDFVTLNAIEDIDACGFHLYPDDIHGHWDWTDEQVRRWIEGHAADAHERIDKPVYCGEWAYGARRDTENATERIARRNRKYEQYFEWFDRYDVDGSVLYELIPGDPHPYPHDNAVYCPEDGRTCALVAAYGETVAEKSGNAASAVTDTTADS